MFKRPMMPSRGAVQPMPAKVPLEGVSYGTFNPAMGKPDGGLSTASMGRIPAGPSLRGMKKGGKVKSSASKRADGVAQRGKTKGRFV